MVVNMNLFLFIFIKYMKQHTLKKNKSNKLKVGMLTVPLNPDGKCYEYCGNSYIASGHIEWLKQHNVQVIPIPYYTKQLNHYISQVNGLYLPSGGAFANTQKEYYYACKKLLYMAIEENNKGNYFPVWGGCMGMQQMMMIADNMDNLDLLETFDSFDNLNLTLKFITDPRESRLFKNIDEKFLFKLATENCTLNNHKMGLSLETFKANPRISCIFKVLTTSFDRQGVEFVSTIEAHNYPFYGFQWHPERNSEMDVFVKVFADDAHASPKKTHIPNRQKLQFRRIHCMNYSGNIYKYCNFYWHDRSSHHNKKLCSVLNLGNPVDNAV